MRRRASVSLLFLFSYISAGPSCPPIKNAEENGKVGQIPQVYALHPWRHGGGLRCDVASGGGALCRIGICGPFHCAYRLI